MTASVSKIAYTSALQMLAVFGSLIVLVVVLYTNGAPTWSPILEPSVYNRKKILLMITKLKVLISIDFL